MDKLWQMAVLIREKETGRCKTVTVEMHGTLSTFLCSLHVV